TDAQLRRVGKGGTHALGDVFQGRLHSRNLSGVHGRLPAVPRQEKRPASVNLQAQPEETLACSGRQLHLSMLLPAIARDSPAASQRLYALSPWDEMSRPWRSSSSETRRPTVTSAIL